MGLIFFKGPFGGAYVRREICVSKSIGLACSGKEIYQFCFFYVVFEGGLYSDGRFNGGFFVLRLWGGLYLEGLVHRAAYFRNSIAKGFFGCLKVFVSGCSTFWTSNVCVLYVNRDLLMTSRTLFVVILARAFWTFQGQCFVHI